VAHFCQCLLTPVREGDPGANSCWTPWGTRYVPFPRDVTDAEIGAPILNIQTRMTEDTLDEESLLRALQGTDEVLCDCLTYEDPYHPNYKTRDLRQHPVPMRRKPRAFVQSCAKCKALAPQGAPFKMCTGCHRVRYCSVSCQRCATATKRFQSC
jgi:hypothetical protein